ncbi:MAG: uracil-DNA glycosylase family protein [Pseudomonadota bacterium]
MNFSESAQKSEDIQLLLSSLQQWWKDAGVDVNYRDVPDALLEKIEPTTSKNKPIREFTHGRIAPEDTNSVAECKEGENFPKTLESFLQWLKVQPAVTGQQDSSNAVYPHGPADPEVMVIVAMPDQARSDLQNILDQPTRQLVKNMLRAVNIDIESVFFAPLSLIRPIDGRIEHDLYPALSRRMLKLVELVNPGKIVLFGDTPARVLCSEDLLTARKKKLIINQGSSKTKVIATFHPRILIERPEFKAEAWQDLQQLLGTD